MGLDFWSLKVGYVIGVTSLSNLPQMVSEMAKRGVFEKIVKLLAGVAFDLGKFNLDVGFIDGSFSTAKKGDQKLVPQKRVKAQK